MRGAPSPIERLAALGALEEPGTHRRPSRGAPAGALWDSSQLSLSGHLPINLRRFLSEQLGLTMRVEGETILALEPRSDEVLIRELARAIRRFSAERARQTWLEYAIALQRLKDEFFLAPAAERCLVILCLRCACISTGPLDEHAGDNCMPVSLDPAFSDFKPSRFAGNPAAAADSILHSIENFRIAREAAGLPHYDLDCFIANGQAVFTWRPLPVRP
jgi:hypothetical protein